MVTELIKKEEIIYPDSDGKPMAETDTHLNEMINLLEMLKYHYRNNPKAYVSGNLFLYYQEGNPNKNVAPDVFVVLGVNKKERRTYKTWEEGKAPDVIIEVTSSSTKYKDTKIKMALYRQLGVKEYYLYDPTGDYLPGQLQAHHLKGKDYHLVPSKRSTWKSPVLGLEMKLENGRLRLYDQSTGERLLTPAEQVQAREAAEAARKTAEAERERETQARKSAEAELERLRAELARLKNHPS